MRKIKKEFLFLLFFTFLMIFISQAETEIWKRKIVVFKAGWVNEEKKEALIKRVGGIKIKNLNLINGEVVFLSSKAERHLAKEEGILRIDDDVEVFTLGRESKNERSKIQPVQVLPWGIDRIDADLVWKITRGDSVRVAVIDTGIDLSHADLKANVKGGFSTVSYTSSYNDDNGHGTHVAGIIAALDNDIGVIGVGPQIDLYAIKVLDRYGKGYLSDVIEGLDWVVRQKREKGGDWVINLSLGTTENVESFQGAIFRTNEEGIVLVAAAGNTSGTILYPAAYPEVIAVSALDKQNQIASWSSRGEKIELAAPGVDIYSTYKGSKYKSLSGTSMAAPHVTGVAALILETKKCDYNGDSICNPSEVRQRLRETTRDLGEEGKDILYGWGLVDARMAIEK